MADAVKKVGKSVEEILESTSIESNTIQSISINDVSMGEKADNSWSGNDQDKTPKPQVIRQIMFTCNPTPEPILTSAQFHILLTLAEGQRHGYGIMQEVESRTGGAVGDHGR